MTLVTDRRRFIQTTAVTGLGYWVAGGLEAAVSKSKNEQVQLGCIGVGGKGKSDVENCEVRKDFCAVRCRCHNPRRHGESLQD